MATSERSPVTGTYPPDGEPVRDESLKPSEKFDKAWDDALAKAAAAWGVKGQLVQVETEVQYGARIDITNPGGVGVCSVTLIPL